MKPKGRSKPPKPNPKAVTAVAGEPGDDRATRSAKTVTLPSVQAAATIHEFADQRCETELTVDALVYELQLQCNSVTGGNLLRPEAMLAAQAHTLDAIFNALARRAAGQECVAYYETYMRLAFKAQSQCRATVQTLAEVKNPQAVAFVRQANISAGPQQVNNAPLPAESSRVREIESEPNRLSGGGNGLSPDARTSALAGRTDQAVETMGAIDGPED